MQSCCPVELGGNRGSSSKHWQSNRMEEVGLAWKSWELNTGGVTSDAVRGGGLLAGICVTVSREGQGPHFRKRSWQYLLRLSSGENVRLLSPWEQICRLLFLATRNSFCLICSSFCPGALSRCQWGLDCFTVTVAYFNSTYRNMLWAESLTLKFPCQKVLVKLKKRFGVAWWARFKLLWCCSYLCSSDGL